MGKQITLECKSIPKSVMRVPRLELSEGAINANSTCGDLDMCGLKPNWSSVITQVMIGL